jgi:hypothetical protein
MLHETLILMLSQIFVFIRMVKLFEYKHFIIAYLRTGYMYVFYCPVVAVLESFRFVTRLKRRVPLVEQELPTLPEHMSSPRLLAGNVLLDL